MRLQTALFLLLFNLVIYPADQPRIQKRLHSVRAYGSLNAFNHHTWRSDNEPIFDFMVFLREKKNAELREQQLDSLAQATAQLSIAPTTKHTTATPPKD